jgi:hypothetical protein
MHRPLTSEHLMRCVCGAKWINACVEFPPKAVVCPRCIVVYELEAYDPTTKKLVFKYNERTI